MTEQKYYKIGRYNGAEDAMFEMNMLAERGWEVFQVMPLGHYLGVFYRHTANLTESNLSALLSEDEDE